MAVDREQGLCVPLVPNASDGGASWSVSGCVSEGAGVVVLV